MSKDRCYCAEIKDYQVKHIWEDGSPMCEDCYQKMLTLLIESL